MVLPDQWDLGDQDGPEMNDYEQQMQKFVSDWDEIQYALTITHSELEIGGKSPEDLLKEIILQMKSECNFY